MTKQMEVRSRPSLNSVQVQSNQSASVTPQRPTSTTTSQIEPETYIEPFLSFISENPTVFHAVAYFSKRLESKGFSKLSERDLWTDKLEKGGKYFYSRNGSGLIAFTVGSNYKSGNGVAVIASHVDALTTKLKPVSNKKTKEGFVQLGIAPYAGALNQTWLDRDLGVGGRVLVKDDATGKIETNLVKLGWPIARIPSLAPHFGIAAEGQANKETRMVPIIGLDNTDINGGQTNESSKPTMLGGAGTFAATQPPRLMKAIATELGIQSCPYKFLTKFIFLLPLTLFQIVIFSTGNWKSLTLNLVNFSVWTRNSSLLAESTTNSALSLPLKLF